tara:strand:+ start:1853 stop:2911 length:1059 start_codon:yes stop_codon:yes gene_type:complete
MKSITCFSLITSLYTQKSRRADKANTLINLLNSNFPLSENSEQGKSITIENSIQQIKRKEVNKLLKEYDLEYNYLTCTLNNNKTGISYNKNTTQSLPAQFVPTQLISKLNDLILKLDKASKSSTEVSQTSTIRCSEASSTRSTTSQSKSPASQASTVLCLKSNSTTSTTSQVGSLASQVGSLASEVPSKVHSNVEKLRSIFESHAKQCATQVENKFKHLSSETYRTPGRVYDTTTSAANTGAKKVTAMTDYLATAATKPLQDLVKHIDNKSRDAERNFNIWCRSLERRREELAKKTAWEREKVQNKINDLYFKAAQTGTRTDWLNNLQTTIDHQARLDRTRTLGGLKTFWTN